MSGQPCVLARTADSTAQSAPEIELSVVLGADAQTGGLVYDFRIGWYEILNDQIVEFLNDALANRENGRGQYMYFDVDSGNVYINVFAIGTVGTDGSGTLLFSVVIGGRISYADNAYRLVNPAYAAHPVVGVSWYGATKFCNWLTLQRGMPPSERVYAEGPSASNLSACAYAQAGRG
jgi:formylglycine-generating enzyme required for sulfatase activity